MSKSTLVTIKIRMENAAFDENPELELLMILEALVKRIADGKYGVPGKLLDTNGNHTGTIDFEAAD